MGKYPRLKLSGIFEYGSYAVFVKILSFVVAMGMVKAQLKIGGDKDIAHLSLILQWISFYAFLDFGITNWMSITKVKKNSFTIFKNSGLFAALSVSILFTIFLSVTFGGEVGILIPFLIFVDIFLSYLVLANVIIMTKQEKYLKSFLLQLLTNLGVLIYLVCTIFDIAHLKLDEVILLMITSKVISLSILSDEVLLVIACRNFRKFISNIKYCKRYLIIQVASFIQYGSDIFIAFSLFEISYFNNFSARYRIMAASLVVAGFVTAYMVNYSNLIKNKTFGSLLLIPAIVVQYIFLYILTLLMHIELSFSMLVYVGLIFYISIKNTFYQIVDSRNFYIYFSLCAVPIVAIKYFSMKYLMFDGLAVTAVFQLAALMFYSISFNRENKF